MTDPPTPPLSPEDVAADLGLDMPAMYQRIRRGRGIPPFERHGRRYLIHPDAYAAWKAAQPVLEAARRAAELQEQAARHRTQAAVLEREARALLAAL